MRCQRCQGCMVHRQERPLWLWCCLNCGDRVDQSILFQRETIEMASRRYAQLWQDIQRQCREVAA